MSRAIRMLEITQPVKCKHNFKGARWQELIEIHALEELAGGLTMKCQTENVANAGYWFHWLDNAFGMLAGRLPMSVVDVDKITKDPKLPMTARDPDIFLPLPTLVRQRHQIEFKRRFGLSGDVTGFDVESNWKPTMTPAYGLPILLDPRLNNVTSKFCLSSPKKDEYEYLIHTLHYEWYLRARQLKIEEQRAQHADELRLVTHATEAIARELREEDPLTPEADNDMGWNNPVTLGRSPTRVIELPPLPPKIPLISPEEYLEISKSQYKAYVAACRTVVPWRSLYPDTDLCVGERGVLWQDKLSKVNLAPVWNVLHASNDNYQYGYMIELAKYSRANVYKLQASSFVERVNSAGKIVLNDTNIKLKPDKVEKRVMLRMNRKWMCHMKSTYTDITQDMMSLLRASHEALASTLQNETTRSIPLQMSIDDVPQENDIQ